MFPLASHRIGQPMAPGGGAEKSTVCARFRWYISWGASCSFRCCGSWPHQAGVEARARAATSPARHEALRILHEGLISQPAFLGGGALAGRPAHTIGLTSGHQPPPRVPPPQGRALATTGQRAARSASERTLRPILRGIGTNRHGHERIASVAVPHPDPLCELGWLRVDKFAANEPG